MPPTPSLLLSFLTRRMSDRQRAADVAQETYLKLLNVDESVAVLNDRSFIFRVAGNLAIDTLRREQRLGGNVGDAPLGHTPTARQAKPQPVARPARAWWPALAASVVLAVAGLAGWQQWSMLNSDYHTGVGQQQTVTLADGSKVILNSSSAVSVAFSADERTVILRAGEALFEPVNDSRPFVVRSGDERLEAGNGVFSVRREGDALTLVVSRGQVQLSGAHQPVLVQADQRLEHQSGQPLFAQQKVDAASLTAWQRGKLIFNGRPLGEVIGELERYQHGRILISDRELAALPVSGVFELNDPQGSLRTLEQRYPLKVTHLPWLAVLH